MGKILLLSFLTLSSISFAQLPKSLLNAVQKDYTYMDYTGSVYLNSSYKESSVIHEESTTYNSKLRYNILTDAIEYKSQKTSYVLIKSNTTHVRIGEDYFYYCNFKNSRGLNKSGYYVLLELTDLYRIYKKFSLSITEPAAQQGIVTVSPKPGKIKQKITYYIEETGVIMKLPLNKKEILASFSDKENELKEYFKKEKIRLKKEEDLIRFVAKYNALKSNETDQNRSLLSNTNSGKN